MRHVRTWLMQAGIFMLFAIGWFRHEHATAQKKVLRGCLGIYIGVLLLLVGPGEIMLMTALDYPMDPQHPRFLQALTCMIVLCYVIAIGVVVHNVTAVRRTYASLPESFRKR